MGQTGLGYFSPIAAWNQNKGKVLILDLARFKYPLDWTPINTV
jgi:glutathione gamma-glutamylcysteinyltransferase